ncbi:MAG TPA: hypothetical protein VFE33_14470 [Thermoanaerobaculia bacterium]|nr:hypothetical protein [Thermoanaerobaculia bacterium]
MHGYGQGREIFTHLNPVVLTQLSEALQQAAESRKYRVAGYNGCAISKAQFAEYDQRYEALDKLARQIDSLTGKSNFSEEDRGNLSILIKAYVDQTAKLGGT